MAVIKNFKRTEKKYILSHDTYLALRKMLEGKMQEDEYGWDTICSLYLDTDNFDLIRRSIDKPIYKEKLRMRSYGVPDDNKKVYIELKKKYDKVVYKRRISLPYCEACDFINEPSAEKAKPKDKQIANELTFAINRYGLKPAMVIIYDRVALFGVEDPALRITFDTNVRARDNQLELSAGDHGHLVLERGKYIMEIKVNGAMPLWLVKALRELDIKPHSFSKYGTAYKQKLGIVEIPQ